MIEIKPSKRLAAMRTALQEAIRRDDSRETSRLKGMFQGALRLHLVDAINIFGNSAIFYSGPDMVLRVQEAAEPSIPISGSIDRNTA